MEKPVGIVQKLDPNTKYLILIDANLVPRHQAIEISNMVNRLVADSNLKTGSLWLGSIDRVVKLVEVNNNVIEIKY